MIILSIAFDAFTITNLSIPVISGIYDIFARGAVLLDPTSNRTSSGRILAPEQCFRERLRIGCTTEELLHRVQSAAGQQCPLAGRGRFTSRELISSRLPPGRRIISL
jgi:hypothetical protein